MPKKESKPLTPEEFDKLRYEESLAIERGVKRSLFEVGKEDLLCQNCCNPEYLIVEATADHSSYTHFSVIFPDGNNVSFKSFDQFEKFFERLREKVRALVS